MTKLITYTLLTSCFYYAAGASSIFLYTESSNANIAQKIMLKNNKPTVNPAPFPNDKEMRWIIMIAKTMFAIGIKNIKIHHQGLFAILSIIRTL